jgi:hypothetical protein
LVLSSNSKKRDCATGHRRIGTQLQSPEGDRSMADAFNMPPPSAGFDARAGWLVQQFMVDIDGLKLNHAGGIVGNFGGESGLLAVNEKHPLVAGSRGGWSWGQWTGPRRTAMESFAAAHGFGMSSDELAYRWTLEELRTTHKHALDQLLKTSSIEAAVETFEAYYERPADLKAGLADRIAFAKRAITASIGLAHVDDFVAHPTGSTGSADGSRSSSVGAGPARTPPAIAPGAAGPPARPGRRPVSAGKMTGGAGIGMALTITIVWVLSLYQLHPPEYVVAAWTLLLSIPGAIVLHCLPWLKSELPNV